MIIHQILINDSNKLPKSLPKFYYFCFDQIKKIYPNEKYHLYCGEEIEEIIKDNFDSDVYISYLKLNAYACKADLARLCLLYLYGGLYADLTLYFLNPVPDLDILSFFAFRDRQKVSMQSWSVQNCIMFSHEKTKVVENAIKIIIENCKKEHYGIQPVDVSATTVLGKSIMNSLPNLGISTKGQEDFILKNNLDPKIVDKLNENGYSKMDIIEGYISDIGDKLIAIRKPSPDGNIKTLGFEGTNNFISMWNDKIIYNSKYKLFDKK